MAIIVKVIDRCAVAIVANVIVRHVVIVEVSIVSRHAVAIVVVVVARRAVAIIVDFVARRIVAPSPSLLTMARCPHIGDGKDTIASLIAHPTLLKWRHDN